MSLFHLLGSFVALDFETTGLDFHNDDIIEIGAIYYEQGIEIQRYSTLVNPGRPISLEISQLTGITNTDVAHAPSVQTISSDFYDFVSNKPIMAHNAGFELHYLKKIFGKSFLPPRILDTTLLLALVYPLAPRLSLEHFIKYFGIRDYELHRGLQDALDMVHVVRCIDEELESKEFAPLCAIVRDCFCHTDSNKNNGWVWAPLFVERHKQQTQKPKLQNYKTYYSKREKFEVPQSFSNAPEQFVALLKNPENELPLTQRPSQHSIIQKAAQILNDGGTYIVEAGTGTGKTLAYLTAGLAALAVDNSSPIVISTHTKALQQQLLIQEFPKLQRLFHLPDLTMVVLKGMNNYVCLLKLFNNLNRSDSLFAEHNTDGEFVRAFVQHWLMITTEGTHDELPKPLFELPVMNVIATNINADNKDCQRTLCSYYEHCFYFKKSWEATSANLLAVNHSLLLSYPKVYPPFDRLIVDEADELWSEAVESYSLTLRFSELKEFLTTLFHPDKPLKALLQELMKGEIESKSTTNSVPRQTAEQTIPRLGASIEHLIVILFSLRPADTFLLQTTLMEDHISYTTQEQINNSIENLSVGLQDLISFVQNLIKDAQRLDREDLNEILQQSSFILEQLTSFAETLQHFLQKTVGYAHFLRIDQHQCSVHVSPYDVGKVYAEKMAQNLYGSVYTSATLSSTKDMNDFIKKMGFHAEQENKYPTPLVKNRFISPFNYAKQSKIVFLKNFPQNTQPQFIPAAISFIHSITTKLGGKTLILFTSKQRLLQVHNGLFPLLAEQGFELITHGITHTSQHKAQEHFCQSNKAVFMGARGLWKGVDIPGDQLQCLIIEKMPYPVPNPYTKGLQDELVRFYAEEYEQRGEMPDKTQLARIAWNEVDKPQMFQAFRQMFGRLIRTETDRGIMFVLDSQLQQSKLSARHKQLMELLPGVPYSVSDLLQAEKELYPLLLDPLQERNL